MKKLNMNWTKIQKWKIDSIEKIWFIKGNKKKTDNFQIFKTIRTFGREIYNTDLSIHDATELQIRLKDDVNSLKNLQNQKNQSENKRDTTLKTAIILLNGRQRVLNAFESRAFPKRKQGEGLKSISANVARVAKVSNH